MKRLIYLLLTLGIASELLGQQETIRTLRLDSVTITARRPIRDIGATKTQIDTLILRQSITNSLADILSQSTAVFVKSYGRGTMATASFRGTSPAHTQVLWNGMSINSPMLGQVDFSLLPSYIVDDMSLWHGSSASTVGGNALGGAISIGTKQPNSQGHHIDIVQSLGSFHSYDGYLRYLYGGKGWSSSTRVYLASSRNDFIYRNFSKVNLLSDGSISEEYERSRNRSSDYRDLHLMQELYYDAPRIGKLSFTAWLMDSRRGIPMLSTDQKGFDANRIRQNQTTLRLLGGWNQNYGNWSSTANIGFTSDHLLYSHQTNPTEPNATFASHANSYVYSTYAQLSTDYRPTESLLLRGQWQGYYHMVDSWDRVTRTGYPANRLESSWLLSLRYRPNDRWAIATNLREQYYGHWSVPALALLGEYLLLPRWNTRLKASVSNNFRYPSLNDLHFVPGGNRGLLPEKSLTYDVGLSAQLTDRAQQIYSLTAEATVYDSYIRDWILWLPTFKGYWTPMNIRQVHSYGAELKLKSSFKINHYWSLWFDTNYTLTHSINEGTPLSEGDSSIGKQLPYIPQRQGSVMAQISYRDTRIVYKYNYYSERFTTTSNALDEPYSRIGAYHMNDLSIEQYFRLWHQPASVKLSIQNLFDEEYVSVLQHPMPGRNYSLSFALHL